ncbi:MAG: nuclear transport factor 2 family protein [Parasphingorhabdus sp.]
MSGNANLTVWHEHMKTKTHEGLLAQIADDAVFHSPVVHTPQAGKKLVFAYLSAADQVFDDANFAYVDEIVDDAGNKAMLEFTAEIDGIHINGIDIIHWNEEGEIQNFKVLVRPMKAMNMLWEKMAAMLETMKG